MKNISKNENKKKPNEPIATKTLGSLTKCERKYFSNKEITVIKTTLKITNIIQDMGSGLILKYINLMVSFI